MKLAVKIHDSENFIFFTNLMIIVCAILVAVETSMPELDFLPLFVAFDYFVICYFTFEMIIRCFVLNRNRHTPQYASDLFWFIFDGLIVIVSFLALASHFLNHPEAVSIFRLFRIFRILRLFEISPKIKAIEKKIIAVIPTLITFMFLLMIIIFIYSIVGMQLFQKQKFDTLSFATLYDATKSMFIFITNDYSGFIIEIKAKCPHISKFVVDLFFMSFFIISAMVMMNVFVAVLTNNIQDELKKEIMEIEHKEDDNNIILNKKIDALMDEIKTIKEKLK